jgi:hypothetical protein
MFARAVRIIAVPPEAEFTKLALNQQPRLLRVSELRRDQQILAVASFAQNEENACAYVPIKSRETPSNTGITLFVGANSVFILVKEDDEFILRAIPPDLAASPVVAGRKTEVSECCEY